MSIKLERVLVADPAHQICVKILQSYGVEVTHGVKLTPQELCMQIGNYDGLIVRSETKVTEEVLKAGAAGRLKVVGRAGTGVDNIDLKAATKLGIYVLNTPGGNSLSACELTCALISAVARNVGGGVVSIKEGRWDRKQLMGTELYGKTLAVIGLGRIGREVALRMRSYGMKVIGFDPLINDSQAKQMGVELYSDLKEIWPLADYITLHVPLNQHTKDLVDEETFSLCKKGVKVINVARGGIINEHHLLTALKNGECGGAGLDVFSEEPPKSQYIWDLIKHPLVTATPHLGASTVEAQRRVAEEIAEQFVALANPNSGFNVGGAVNSDVLSALSQASNGTLVSLARAMGALAVSLTSISTGSSLHIQTESKYGEAKWVKSCMAEGLVGKTGPGCLETVKQIGVDALSYFHSDANHSRLTLTVITKSGKHTIIGSYESSDATLVSVDGAVFKPNFPLGSKPRLMLTTSEDLSKTLGLILNSKDISSVGMGKTEGKVWLCINS